MVTSTLSKVEVAWFEIEHQPKLTDADKEKLDDFWNDSSLIELVEFNDDIAIIARDIMRNAKSKGWSPKPNDSIYMALQNGLALIRCSATTCLS